LSRNDIVEPGAVVAYSGEHLHFEIRPAPPEGKEDKERSDVYINPLTFFSPELQAIWVANFEGDYNLPGWSPLSLGYYTSFPTDCP
jgi:hypothetical protein